MKTDHVTDWKADSRLLGGLTNSSVDSLDVTLSLPELPRDPRDTPFNRPRTGFFNSVSKTGCDVFSQE